MTEMFGEAWSPMSVPDLAPDDDDERDGYKHNSETTSLGCKNDCNQRLSLF